MGGSILMGYPNSWMVFSGQSYENRWWFGGTPMTQETSLYWEYDQSNGDIPFLKPTRIGADAAGLAVATAVFFHGEMIGAVCIGIIQTWNPQIQMDTQPTTGMDKMGVSSSSWGYIPKKGLMYKGKSQPKMDDDLGVALFQETTISGWGYYTRIKNRLI